MHEKEDGLGLGMRYCDMKAVDLVFSALVALAFVEIECLSRPTRHNPVVTASNHCDSKLSVSVDASFQGVDNVGE
jgi:hypothetical protein